MKRGTVIPAFLDPGVWSASFGMSLRDLCLYDATTSHRIVRAGGRELRSLSGPDLATARNTVAAMFLDDTDAEWLWFVDSDMGFSPDTVDRLVASADPVSRRVVGALCFAQKRRSGRGDFHAERYVITPTIYEYVELDDQVGFRPVADYERDALQKVAATGCACILIHRSVLHKIREAHGPVWFDHLIHPGKGGGARRTFSEDLSFCVRAAGVGEDLYVDSSVKTSHHKGGLFLDEDAYDRDRALARLEMEAAL